MNLPLTGHKAEIRKGPSNLNTQQHFYRSLGEGRRTSSSEALLASTPGLAERVCRPKGRMCHPLKPALVPSSFVSASTKGRGIPSHLSEPDSDLKKRESGRTPMKSAKPVTNFIRV